MAYDTGLWGNPRDGIGFFSFATSSVSVDFSVEPQLNFVGNDFTFSADVTSAGLPTDWQSTYTVNFGDSTVTATTNFSITRAYIGRGTYNTTHTYEITDGADTKFYVTSAITGIEVNPLPDATFIGIPRANSPLTFYDTKGGYYITSTIVSADWDFGDGFTSATTDTTDTFEHTYTTEGIYTVSVSAHDINGNVGVDTLSVGIVAGSVSALKQDYITLCGPDMLGRYGVNRQINLTKFLPLYLKGGETESFLVLFEEFLNTMFDGKDGWVTSADELDITKSWAPNTATSAEPERTFTYDLCGTDTPTDANAVSALSLHYTQDSLSANPKMSILEKVYRIAELHDPDLIDIDYIQYFAQNLGYQVSVFRDELGVSGTAATYAVSNPACGTNEINRYLRFVVRNLPTWYKIKTTRNAVKVMLYSFGLVGDIIEFYTNNYLPRDDGGNWRLDFNEDLAEIPDKWYPTPHFSILVNLDESADISFDVARRDKVIRAIESIRPVNNVFRRLSGFLQRTYNIEMALWTRMTRYKEIKSNGYSNSWWDGSPL